MNLEFPSIWKKWCHLFWLNFFKELNYNIVELRSHSFAGLFVLTSDFRKFIYGIQFRPRTSELLLPEELLDGENQTVSTRTNKFNTHTKKPLSTALVSNQKMKIFCFLGYQLRIFIVVSLQKKLALIKLL